MSRISSTIAVLAAAVAFAPAQQAVAASHPAKTQHAAKKHVRAHSSAMRCTGRRADC